MFIRFVVATDSDNPWWANGVISTARIFRDDGRLEPYQVAVVEEAFAWFNQHLPRPPFAANLESGAWSSAAVAWFIHDAKEPISRMWDLVAVIKEHGASVHILRSENPGMIVYRDAFQVIAETPDNA